MTKRNFILLIIIVITIVIVIFGFLYFSQPKTPTGDDTGGTNFFSQFNPFGSGTTKQTCKDSKATNNGKALPCVYPSITICEDPNATNNGEILPCVYTPEQEELVLKKVSSMPIAGFGVYTKERLIDVPIPTEAPATDPVITYNFGTTTLKNGSTGEAVKELQKFLNNTLTLELELDGILDEEIVIIIKQWQKDHGLIADGIIGSKTKTIMYSSVNQTNEISKPTPPATEFMPALRYVDRATGNIYQTFADKIEERKFSTTVIPKVYEALFGNKGESVIMRYLKENGRTIITFAGNLPKELLGGDTIENNEIKGVFLPEGIKDISLSPDSSSIFYLFNVGDNMVGTTLNLSNNKKVQIFDSPFTEWLSLWPNNKMITFTTKPSSGVPGYMYAMDPNNKYLNKILGGVNGLTTLTSPSGKLILYGNNNLSLNIYHTDTKTSDLLGIKTLPEKCVWDKMSDFIYCGVPQSADTGGYPDIWYQGEISFSDQFWKIDVETGNTTIIADPITIVGGEEIDSIKFAIDEGENYLFFVNKKDSFLWELKLK
jgi:peptidoglycan hydrolase-like protein with peptidoglycan-binding domain